MSKSQKKGTAKRILALQLQSSYEVVSAVSRVGLDSHSL
jgi:hypothetical protein